MMELVVSATEARIHFGELMQKAQDAPIIVERSGKALVVLLSKQAYDDLVAGGSRQDWTALVEAANRRVRADLQGRTPPSAEKMISEARQERDEQTDHLR